jgi:hypothetical protein
VGEGESPQTQVGGGVGDCAKDKLNGVDHLVHQDLPKVKVVAMTVVTMAATAVITTMATATMCRALLMRLIATMATNQLDVSRPATSSATKATCSVFERDQL